MGAESWQTMEEGFSHYAHARRIIFTRRRKSCNLLQGLLCQAKADTILNGIAKISPRRDCVQSLVRYAPPRIRILVPPDLVVIFLKMSAGTSTMRVCINTDRPHASLWRQNRLRLSLQMYLQRWLRATRTSCPHPTFAAGSFATPSVVARPEALPKPSLQALGSAHHGRE